MGMGMGVDVKTKIKMHSISYLLFCTIKEKMEGDVVIVYIFAKDIILRN